MVKALVHVKETFAVNPTETLQAASSTEPLETDTQNRYVFAYDPTTIEELEAVERNHSAGKAGGPIE